LEKKLFRVEVCLYVMAQDEYEACWAAANAQFQVFECAAAEAKTVDPGWEDAVPYNADDDRTCSEIITQPVRARPSRAKPVPVSRRRTVNPVATEIDALLKQFGPLTLVPRSPKRDSQ
jgi:hypothetical protein